MIDTVPVPFRFLVNDLKVTLVKAEKKLKKLMEQISNIFYFPLKTSIQY